MLNILNDRNLNYEKGMLPTIYHNFSESLQKYVEKRTNLSSLGELVHNQELIKSRLVLCQSTINHLEDNIFWGRIKRNNISEMIEVGSDCCKNACNDTIEKIKEVMKKNNTLSEAYGKGFSDFNEILKNYKKQLIEKRDFFQNM